MFEIAKFELSNEQYAAFLNSVARSDPHGLYSTRDAHEQNGIMRSGSDGSFAYTVKPGYEHLPVVEVNFFDAMRFANWLHNGATSASDTETGAYTLSTSPIMRNPVARFAVPTENEWYKAAYYESGQYWLYATRSDSPPTPELPPGGVSSANITGALGSVFLHSEGGAYSLSRSYYGTHDQTGNVWEWNETSLNGVRGIRGGSAEDDESKVRSTFRFANANDGPSWESGGLGFRIIRLGGPVQTDPRILVQPADVEVPLGGTARFSVSAVGSSPLTLQWRFNGARIIGGTGPELVLNNVTALDVGEYTVEVSTPAASVLSDFARLFMFQDSDGDGLSDNYESGVTRYKLIQGNFTWFQARADAERRGGHLATITSEAEWNAIKAALSPVALEGKIVWIGGTDSEVEGSWQWITGEPWGGFVNWRGGEPNGLAGGGDSDFIEMTQLAGSPWNDSFGTEQREFYLLEFGFYSDPNNPDTDGEGLSDFDEIDVTGTFPNFSDSDGDGFSDRLEVESGTNPLDRNETPEGILRIFQAVEVEFISKPGQRYQLQVSQDLQNWTDLDNPILGTVEKIQRLYSIRGTKKLFYRVTKLPN